MIKICLIITLVELITCVVVSAAIAAKRAKEAGKQKPKTAEIKKKSKFQRLLFEFPYRVVTDMYDRQDYEFTESGLHLIAGEQGSGKTSTVVYLLREYKELYPEIKIRTNMEYTFEDGTISSWKDIVFKNNGVQGQIDVIDEIQNWFNSLESKDFPIEMFQEITQQRKQRKMIIGTSQVWQRVAKPLREQTKLLYKPITILGALTIVRVYKPIVNSDGEVTELKFRRAFFFVHDKELRNSFDTYKAIQAMSLKGFKPQAEQIRHTAQAASPSAPKA